MRPQRVKAGALLLFRAATGCGKESEVDNVEIQSLILIVVMLTYMAISNSDVSYSCKFSPRCNLAAQTNTGKECHSQCSTNVDKAQIAPVPESC